VYSRKTSVRVQLKNLSESTAEKRQWDYSRKTSVRAQLKNLSESTAEKRQWEYSRKTSVRVQLKNLSQSTVEKPQSEYSRKPSVKNTALCTYSWTEYCKANSAEIGKFLQMIKCIMCVQRNASGVASIFFYTFQAKLR